MAHVFRVARFFALLSGVDAVSVRGAQKVTPVEKVLELMHSLQAELEQESKQAAAEYDKQACACKDQVDEKQYLIEKSDKHLAKLQAEITKLSDDVSILDNDVSALAQSIASLETESQNATATREDEHAAYLAKDKDVTTAIDQLNRAIDAMKDSKSQMSGAKLDLAQMAHSAVEIASASTDLALSEEQMDAMATLAGLGDGQEPSSYEHHSNKIIEVLDGLKKTFLQKKKEQDDTEFESNSAYEKRDTDLKNSIKFQSKDKAEKQKISAYKTEVKEKTVSEQSEEQADRTSTHSLLQEIMADCETKATNFDADSNTRANELTAMASAIETLKAGVFLQAPVAETGRQRDESATPPAPSLLQVRSASREVNGEAMQLLAVRKIKTEVADQLASDGRRYGSHALILASMRVQAAEDHFVKVRQLIKDLMSRLEQDAASEASQKSFCDEAMTAAINARDSSIAQLETLAANKFQLDGEQKQLEKDIAELASAIADANKALVDATSLRDQEKAQNAQALATAEQGKNAVSNAMQTLKDFYGVALLQANVAAPYAGDQAKSKGIIGLLEVILSDFERDITTVTNEEQTAQTAFDTFKTDTQNDISAKEALQTTKENRITEIKDLLVTNASDTEEQDKLKIGALESLEGLHGKCVAGEETYADGVAKREREIESLKEALDMLTNWQS